MKTMELKSAFKTKTEWKDFVNKLYEAGRLNLDGLTEMLHVINESCLPD